MKKIDLHIHTLSTVWEGDFSFNLGNLNKYVSEAKLDAIAITNHNMFDGVQFRTIGKALEVVVFPGIEVSLDCGHILIISDGSDLQNFEDKANLVADSIKQIEDCISVDELEKIFGELNDYLVIPHYQKGPSITGEALNRIASYISAGEVDSPKKFIRTIKDGTKIAPVLFSDVRICDELDELPTRQTFIDCGELTLNAIKACLQDKKKVALYNKDGNNLFEIFANGQKLSTGLNILLGERSTGKTVTLDKINKLWDNVKYIEQFSLVQKDEATSDRKFNDGVKRKRSEFTEEYLSGFKVVLSEVMNVDLQKGAREVESYVSTLLEFAEERERLDIYSKTALFNESKFPISEDNVLDDLIRSVEQIIENLKFRDVIKKYINLNSMKRLACELIKRFRTEKFETKKKKLVNDLIRDIKVVLKRRSSVAPVEDVDLYSVNMDRRKVEKFTEIVKLLQRKATIWEESIVGFRIVVEKGAFSGAGEVKSASGEKVAFSASFKKYEQPYNYLQTLLTNESLTRSELYRLFVKISYRILNKDGSEVSGGERSEFRLLQEINDAKKYNILLIDEPESSFDNLFLNSDVNQIIKEISDSMPVVVVTHNNTVGASIGADYLLYASKKIEEEKPVYKLYSGYPKDQHLMSPDGKTIRTHEIMLNSLEAGYVAYNIRKQGYEAIKN